MSSLTILLVSISCVLYLHGSGVHALECYSCSNCNDPFKSSGVSTTSCSESCMKTKGEKDGEQFVIRGCGQSKTNECKTEKYAGVDVNVCMCTGALCNTADNINMRVSLPIIFTVILAIARKLL